MPTRTVSNSGGNWNSTGTWVEGAVPTSADDVVFTATSGNLTVNVASACLSINFTNYVGTITFNNTLTVSGNVNLGTGGYTQAGASPLRVTASGTLTGGGVTWSRGLTFLGTSQTYTISGTWNQSGTLTLSATTGCVINTGTINLSGNLVTTTTARTTGTATIVLNGTSTWSNSSTGYLALNLTINTSGTITFASGNLYYGDATPTSPALTFMAGTIVRTGNTLNIQQCTINGNNYTINNMNLAGFNNYTYTINSHINVVNLGITGGGSNILSGAGSINVSGNLTRTANVNASGTGTITFTGTGTWSDSFSATAMNWTIIFNTAGTITISGMVNKHSGVITHLSGAVSGGIISVTGTSITFNTSGVTFNNVRFEAGFVNNVTLNSTLNSDTITVIGVNSVNFIGTSGFNCNTLNMISGSTVTLKNGVTYDVNTLITRNTGANSTITSDSPTLRAILHYNGYLNSLQNIGNFNLTRIDARGGYRILTAQGVTQTNCLYTGIGQGDMLHSITKI